MECAKRERTRESENLLRRMRHWSICEALVQSDSDASGLLTATPSEGRQSWHCGTEPSPQPIAISLSGDYGPGGPRTAAGAGGPQDSFGSTIRAGWNSGQTGPDRSRVKRIERLRDLRGSWATLSCLTRQSDARDSALTCVQPTRRGMGPGRFY